MAPRPNSHIATALAAVLAAASLSDAAAWAGSGIAAGGFGTLVAGPGCTQPTQGGSTLNINKNVNIYKPVTINNKVSIYKPITINKPVTINNNVNISKNISIYKPVTINNNVNVTKNIDLSKNINIDNSVTINKNINLSKNITINKSIVINKGAGAEASASAFAAASAQASANAQATVYGGSQYVSIVNKAGGNVGGNVSVNAQCVEQDANVVKSIHAVCVDRAGREYPASHMIADTWINAAYEGEIARCIPGATVKALVGDVTQSDQGLAGTYESGQVRAWAAGEALGQYRGGMLKCAPAKPVKDCTERVNLRRWGSGDFFFSFRSRVCVASPGETASAASGQDLSGMTLEGGVGGEDSGY